MPREYVTGKQVASALRGFPSQTNGLGNASRVLLLLLLYPESSLKSIRACCLRHLWPLSCDRHSLLPPASSNHDPAARLLLNSLGGVRGFLFLSAAVRADFLWAHYECPAACSLAEVSARLPCHSSVAEDNRTKLWGVQAEWIHLNMRRVHRGFS